MGATVIFAGLNHHTPDAVRELCTAARRDRVFSPCATFPLCLYDPPIARHHTHLMKRVVFAEVFRRRCSTQHRQARLNCRRFTTLSERSENVAAAVRTIQQLPSRGGAEDLALPKRRPNERRLSVCVAFRQEEAESGVGQVERRALCKAL